MKNLNVKARKRILAIVAVICLISGIVGVVNGAHIVLYSTAFIVFISWFLLIVGYDWQESRRLKKLSQQS